MLQFDFCNIATWSSIQVCSLQFKIIVKLMVEAATQYIENNKQKLFVEITPLPKSNRRSKASKG